MTTLGFIIGLLLAIDLVFVVVLWRRVSEHDRQLEELYELQEDYEHEGEDDERN